MFYFIAPAGSNVAYISLIFNQESYNYGLAYHSRDIRPWTHDLNYKNIAENNIKIYFNDNLELIILNWFYKFIVKPDNTDWVLQYATEWTDSQKKVWSDFGEDWCIRAVLKWMYNIHADPNYKSKIVEPGKNFCGSVLYNGYDLTKEEFKKHHINYTKEEYQKWLNSQKPVIDSWKHIKDTTAIDKIKKLKYNFEKGVALGLYGLKNKLTEEVTWQHYIK